MAEWILVLIIAFQGQMQVVIPSIHSTMDKCFAAREDVVEMIGRPIAGYQAVCILSSDSPPKVQALL